MAKSTSEENSRKKSGCVRAKCSCTSTFQDRLYGTGIRIWNCTASGGRNCTVCGTQQK